MKKILLICFLLAGCTDEKPDCDIPQTPLPITQGCRSFQQQVYEEAIKQADRVSMYTELCRKIGDCAGTEWKLFHLADRVYCEVSEMQFDKEEISAAFYGCKLAKSKAYVR